MDFGVFNLIVQKQTLYSEASIVIYVPLTSAITKHGM